MIVIMIVIMIMISLNTTSYKEPRLKVHSQRQKISILGVLPETKNMITGSIITSITYILSGLLPETKNKSIGSTPGNKK